MRTYQLLFLLLICVSFYQLTFSGIVGLKKSLYSRFPRSFYKFSVARENFKFPIEVDHLCIDMNEILHRTVGRRRTLEKSTKLFWSKLDLLISDIAPKKSVIFAFDGPAPFAKLLLQRKIRVFDDRAIKTPGKDLMNEMENLILFLHIYLYIIFMYFIFYVFIKFICPLFLFLFLFFNIFILFYI